MAWIRRIRGSLEGMCIYSPRVASKKQTLENSKLGLRLEKKKQCSGRGTYFVSYRFGFYCEENALPKFVFKRVGPIYHIWCKTNSYSNIATGKWKYATCWPHACSLKYKVASCIMNLSWLIYTIFSTLDLRFRKIWFSNFYFYAPFKIPLPRPNL